MRIISGLVQGSKEWIDLRAGYFTASEAPAMLGLSKYKPRADLVREKATGIVPEVDDATQRRFNAGHAAEEKMRAWAEKFIGDDLYPVVGVETVDGLPLLASFDGLTMDGATPWENKLWNEEFAEQVRSGIVPDTHWPQLEQQLLISGANAVLFTVGDGDNEVHVMYESQPERRERILAGWKQFSADMLEYRRRLAAGEIEQPKEAPKAEVTIELPALFVHAKGEITTHNMDEFGAALTARLAETRAIALITDQDFSNAKEAAKTFRETAKKIAASKEAMLAQTETIGEAARKMDAWAKDLNATALQLEKDVEREDKAKKETMVLKAAAEFRYHVDALEAETRPIKISVPQPDFAAAIKGKRNYASMQDAVDTALANAKIAADAVAKDVRAKLAWCKEHAAGHGALFPDLQSLTAKPFDDFTLTITSRIEKQKAEESERLKAERVRIQAEEEAKARAKIEAEQSVKNNHQSEAVMHDGARPAVVPQMEPAAPVNNPVVIGMDMAKNGSDVAMVSITQAEYDRLVARDDWLGWLEAAGVDNWQGIDEAYDMRREAQEVEA